MIRLIRDLPILFDRILILWRRYPGRQYLLALLFTLPALLAVLGLQADLSFATMLFTGGWKVFLTNLCLVVLFPYFGLFILAIGNLLPVPPRPLGSYLTSLDVALMHFFSGAGLLTILGFGLGLVGLLVPWVTIPIFCLTLYIYFLQSPDIFQRFLAWVTAGDLGQATPILRYFTILLRVLVLALIFYFLLARGILLYMYTSDSFQLYFPYFAEVRRQHSIWLDPSHPIIGDFLLGRGNGVHLFLTSFTNQFVIQVIGIMYLVSIALIVHQIVYFIIPKNTDVSLWNGARFIFPNCAMLLALCSPGLQSIITGKYHLQTGAFLLFLSWSGLLFLFFDRPQAKWLYRMLLPVVIAIPITLPQYQAFAALILGIASVTVGLRRGLFLAKYNLILIGVGLVVTLGSLMFNQLYLGIGGINPGFLFVPFADIGRLQRWTSIDQILYVNLAQDIGSSIFSLSFILSPINQLINLVSWLKPFLNLPIVFGLFLLLVVRFRLYSHLLIILMLALSLSAWAVGDGLIVQVSWEPFATIGLDGSYLMTNPTISVLLTVFLLLCYLAALFYLLFFLVQILSAWLSGIRVNIIRKLIEPNVLVFIGVFFLYYVLGGFFTSAINQGSIERLFRFQNVYQAIALFTIIILALILLIRWRPIETEAKHAPKSKSSLSPGPILAAAALATQFRQKSQEVLYTLNRVITSSGQTVLIFIGLISLCLAAYQFSLYYIRHSQQVGGSVAVRASRYFLGLEGLIEGAFIQNTSDRWDFQHCLEIAEIVPGDDLVLGLNHLTRLEPCYFSSLLPRIKIIHPYESVLSPYYREALFAPPQQAYAIYKSLSINYFYIRKEDLQFWGPAFSESFSPLNLMNNFDLFWEDENFYILTWRGEGIQPVSPQIAEYIESLRNRARNDENYNLTWTAMLRLQQQSENKEDELKVEQMPLIEQPHLVKAITTSSTHLTLGDPKLLFDGGSDAADAWHTGQFPEFPQWIEIVFDQPVALVWLGLKPQVGGQSERNRAPRDLVVLGSKASETEQEAVLLKFDFDQSGDWTYRQLSTFKDKFERYRFLILDNHNQPEYVTIQDIRLHAVVESGYHGFNIFWYNGLFYALPQDTETPDPTQFDALGLNPAQLLERNLKQYQAFCAENRQCVIAGSLEEIKQLVDQLIASTP